jgi:hypothetical protein
MLLHPSIQIRSAPQAVVFGLVAAGVHTIERRVSLIRDTIAARFLG